MSEKQKIVKFTPETVIEKSIVEKNLASFAVTDRGTKLFVSTKLQDESLKLLPGWSLILSACGIRRFLVNIHKDDLLTQLRTLYGEENILVVA